MTIKARATGLPAESLRALALSLSKACVTGLPADSLGLLALSLSKACPIDGLDPLNPRLGNLPSDTCPDSVPDTLENDRDTLVPGKLPPEARPGKPSSSTVPDDLKLRPDRRSSDTCADTVPEDLDNARDDLQLCSPANSSLAISESGSSSHFRPSQA